MAFFKEERKMDCQLCRIRKAETDGLCGCCQQWVAERDARRADYQAREAARLAAGDHDAVHRYAERCISATTRSLVREGARIDDAYRRLEIARANYNAVRTSPRVHTLSQAEYNRLSAEYSAEYEVAVRELRGLGVSID